MLIKASGYADADRLNFNRVFTALVLFVRILKSKIVT